jgi:hypothetical protein
MTIKDKTFKEFKEEKNKPQDMETFFGSHCLPKDKKQNMETVFGSHSAKDSKSPLKEDKQFDSNLSGRLTDDMKTVKPHVITSDQNTHIHEKVAPLDADKMSGNEAEAISDYSDESKPLNSLLHQHSKGHDISQDSKKQYRKTINYLDSVLSRRKTNEDIHVYTGLKKSPAAYFTYNKGVPSPTQEVHLPAFTSTSTSIKSARGFSEPVSHVRDENHGISYPTEENEVRHILKIHVPKGTHGMSLKGASFAPEENEILLHRGHNLEISSNPEHISKDTYLWHGKLISHAPKNLE